LAGNRQTWLCATRRVRRRHGRFTAIGLRQRSRWRLLDAYGRHEEIGPRSDSRRSAWDLARPTVSWLHLIPNAKGRHGTHLTIAQVGPRPRAGAETRSIWRPGRTGAGTGATRRRCSVDAGSEEASDSIGIQGPSPVDLLPNDRMPIHELDATTRR